MLIEIGARLHGGEKTPVISRLCTGGALDRALKARLDPARFDAALDRPYPMRQHGAMVYLMPWRTGLFRGYGRLREIARLPSFFEVFNLAAPGPLVRRVAGLVILIHPDPDVLSADVARLRAFEEDGLYRFEDRHEPPRLGDRDLPRLLAARPVAGRAGAGAHRRRRPRRPGGFRRRSVPAAPRRPWHLFFEVLDRDTGRGAIGLADSADGRRFTYRQVVLREPFHLSYPFVFEWEGEVYMTPEALDAGGVRLYRATRFPLEWTPVATLVAGRLADPTVFRHDGRWWLFACGAPASHDDLRLFTAGALEGPWSEHPQSRWSPATAAPRAPRAGRSSTTARGCASPRTAIPSTAAGCGPSASPSSTVTATPKRSARPTRCSRPRGKGGAAAACTTSTPIPRKDGDEAGWIACVDGCAERESNLPSKTLPPERKGPHDHRPTTLVERAGSFTRHRGPVTCVAGLPGGAAAVTSAYDGAVGWFDLASGAVGLLRATTTTWSTG